MKEGKGGSCNIIPCLDKYKESPVFIQLIKSGKEIQILVHKAKCVCVLFDIDASQIRKEKRRVVHICGYVVKNELAENFLVSY